MKLPSYSQMHHEAQDILTKDAYGGKCARCSVRDKRILQYDHIRPVKRKSKHDYDKWDIIRVFIQFGKLDKNVQLLCVQHHYEKTLEDIEGDN